MPIIKSSKKRMKQTRTKRKRNVAKLRKHHEIFKIMEDLIKKSKKEEAEKLLPKFFSSVDKLAKKNIYHDNKAARKKSSISLKINQLKAKKA